MVGRIQMNDARSHATIREKAIVLLEDRRVFISLMVVFSALVLIGTARSNMWGDLNHYYDNAGDVLNGLMPYSEAKFEYPPLSLLFMLIPRIFTWDLNSFHYGCAVLTYVFIAIGSYYLLRMADEYIGCRWQTHLILILLIIFGSYFVIARNDVYPTVLAIIAFWLYLKNRYVPAFVVMALAAMTKMYPAIFLLAMLVPFLMRREWKTGFVCLVAAAMTCLIVELPFLLADPSTAFAYLTYHSDRGIQIESVAAGFFMLYNIFVPGDLAVVFNYGSDNITGVGPDTLAPFMNPIMFLVLVIFVLAVFIRASGSESAKKKIGPIVCIASVTMLMLFVAFSKVYSAQYLIWVVMLLPLTQMSCFSDAHRREILVLLIPFGIFSVLSYVCYMQLGLMDLNTLPILMTFMKNIFHIILTLELVSMCWHEAGSEGGSAGFLSPLWHRISSKHGTVNAE